MDTINRWKRLATGVLGIAAAIAAVPDTRAEIVNVPAGNLQGEHLWVSTNTYVLQGFVYAVEGAVLRIEPGTVVKGVPGTTSANFGNLFICQGAKIFAEGTAQKPIIFTAEEDDVADPKDLGPDDTQLWGGLIVFGKARINAAVNAAGDAASPKYDIYEGLPDNQAANGQFVNRFGGGDDDDSSGAIRYVSIRHGGKLLESNKEVNGLSLCGVGRGTKVEFVEVFANSDDGFEFFGGSVNTRYLVSVFNQDEQFDADQGYNGKNQFWFGIQPAGSVEKGMEINGEPQDRITGSGVPVSNWEVYNATTIGAGARTGTGSGNNAFTLRANTQVGIYNGIFTDFNGLPVTGSNFTTGAKPTVQNNLWWNFTVPTFGPAAAFDGSQGNVTNVNPNLRGISRVADGGLDPRPAAGSQALAGAVTPPDNGFYTKTAFVGAFDDQNLWLRNWTMLDQGGFLPAQTDGGNIVNVPAGYLTGEHVWSSTNVYVLQGFVYLVEGAVLRIEPGTVVKGVPGTTSANFGNLFVCRGAKIFAEGTPQNPIIFTAEEDDVTDPTDLGPDDTQLWGGLIVFGNARINAAVNAAGDAASPKYDIYEGLPDNQASNGQFVNRFGGGNDDDSSGVIRYVSIRHGGKLLESNKEVNGLSLCGVGRGTKVEFVEVFANSDDGFEFFGGSVNTRYLVSAFNQDEQFDADQGYNGKNQFWFGIQPASSVEKGMEINGEPQDRITGSGVPVSNWEVYNATTIGAGARTGSGSGNNAFTLRANTQVGIYNGIFTDFNGLPVTGSNFTTGAKPTVQNNLWWNFTVPTFGPAAAFDGSQGNVTNVNPNLRGISRVADGGLDPRPAAGSLALRGAVTPPDNGFYTKTSFVGAFDHQNLWLRHWTFLDKGGFLPAQTNIVDVPAGYLTGEHVWSNTNVYVLQGFVYLVEGAVLRIEPGTVIKGVAGTTSANFGNLFVCRGAKIFAEGTPQNPIIFTAEEDDVTDPTDLGPDDTQLWGGLIVFGNARINAAVNAAGDAASPKYDIYEGLPDVQASNGQFVNRFGGGNDDDSSGVIRYVSIRHGGKLLESNKEVNGLSLCGVGRGTEVEFVEVYANSDDGFEFFGGSVNTRFLVSAFNQDEQFDADQGYNGRNQFWFGIQPAGSVEKGMEINGEPQDRITGSGVPVSNWEVYNATTIGAGARTGTGSGNNAFTLRANTQVGIYNGIFTDFNGLPVTGSNFTTGAKPTLQDNLWWNFTVPTFGPAAAFAEGQGNLTNVNPEIRGISRTANWGLDPRPATGSPANVSQRIAPANGFYADAKYYGAFTSGGNWVVDWTAIGNSGIMSPSGAYNPVAIPREPDAPLKSALIKPTETLPVTLPNGSVTFGAPGSMTVAGPGLVAWAAAANADQPGDVQEFAYEEITGDFDISTKVTSVISGPVTDPVDAWASGGLQARASLDALSPSFMVNVANPKGVNEVRSTGRAIAAQNYTTFGRTYPGVDKTLPSQWIRLRRVGNWFAAYVGTDGSSWALVGQRWQEWPDKLLVGAYAFSASYNSADQTGGKNLSTVAFSNYGKTVQNDNVAPALVSAATMGKKVVGVKFSEPVASSGALVAANYTLSQGTVTAVQGGIGGDSVYLTVSGLTADTFDVTVNNVTDTAGNALPAGSKVTGRSSAWKSADIGLIQSGNPEVRTAGDDPYRIGQAVAVASGSTETEIEIIGGGSNAWNPGDYIHYVSGIPLVGDFEVTVEVSRNDRPANTAAWANSGLMLRESEYLPGQQYTPDGTKVAMVANTTYIEGSAPNRAGIPLWREEPGAGYGNGNPGFAWTTPIGGIKGYYLDQRAIDAAGTPDPESSPLSSRWLRIKRAGNDFTFFVSYDGWEWALLDGPKTLPLSSQLLFGFSTMSDTGSGAPPNNAYGGNGFLGTDLEGQQNPSNYSVQRIRIGTNVTPRGPGPVTPTVSIQGSTVTFTGKLQEASSLNGPFTEVQGAKTPYTIPVGSEIRFYRASN